MEGSGRGLFEGTGYEYLWIRRRNLRNISIGIIVNPAETGLVQSAHKIIKVFHIYIHIRSKDLIPLRERFSAPHQTGPGAHPASYKMGTGSFLEVERPRRDVNYKPHLKQRLQKEIL